MQQRSKIPYSRAVSAHAFATCCKALFLMVPAFASGQQLVVNGAAITDNNASFGSAGAGRTNSAIYVFNSGSLTGTGLTGTANTSSASALAVESGGGAILSGGSLISSFAGDTSYSVLVRNPGSTATLNNVAISSGRSSAVVADLSGQITLQGGSVSLIRTSGTTLSLALLAQAGSRIDAQGTVISASGSKVRGAGSQNSVIRLTGGSVTVDGNDSYGLYADRVGGTGTSDVLIASGLRVTTTGNNTPAVAVITGANATLSNMNISTSGDDSIGIHGGLGSGVRVTGTLELSTQGARAFAGDASGLLGTTSGTLVFDNITGTLQTNGVQAHGLVAHPGGTVSMTGGSLITRGTDAAALAARAGTINVANANLTSSAGMGALVLQGSTLGLNSTTLSAAGHGVSIATSSGLLLDPPAELPDGATVAVTPTAPAAPSANTVQVQGGRINAGGDLFHVAGTNANITISGGAQASTGSGLLLNALASGAAGSQVSFIMDGVNLNGDIASDAASTVSATLRNSALLTGKIDPVSLDIDGTSRWNMTANSELRDLSMGTGALVQISPPSGGAFKTLTVHGVLSGTGTIGLNTVLAGDGSPSDRVVVDGGIATGNSRLLISNAPDASGALGRGALTTGNGILVVDAVNGGTTAPTAFSLASAVYAGPYEYTLQRSSVDSSNPQAWYLRSTIEPEPPVPPEPGPAPVPNYRPQTSLYAAIPALALVYTRTLVDTLHERVGEERLNQGDARLATDETTYGPSLGWGRMIYRSGEQDGAKSFLGNTPEYNYDLSAFQVGVDLYRDVKADGSHDQAGVSLAVGSIDAGVSHYTGNNSGDDTLRAYSLGGYWTHFGQAGWYLDSVMQVHRFNIEAKPTDIRKLKTHGWGYTASMEAGYPFEVRTDLYVEPQAQVIYSSIDLDNSNDLAANVRFNDVDSLIGRLGVRIAKDWETNGSDNSVRRTNAWVRPSVWHEFKGQPKTEFSSQNGYVPFEADIGGTWGEVNVGVDYQANARTTFTVSTGYRQAFDNSNHGYDGMLGVKVAF